MTKPDQNTTHAHADFLKTADYIEIRAMASKEQAKAVREGVNAASAWIAARLHFGAAAKA
jgi:hypothetical protein